MNIIVTGASRGIGKEIVRFFCEEFPQVINVIAISRNLKELEKNKQTLSHPAQTKLIICPVDLSLTDNLSITISDFLKEQHINEINIVINNAGAIVNKPFQNITTADFDNVVNVNFKAPFFLIQALLPYFNSSKRTHIVNISSMGGFMGSSKFAGLSAYSSSKGALVTLTECLAEEFKEKNIAVNCLCIGAVNTEMLAEAFPGYNANTSAQQMAEYISQFAINSTDLFNGKIIPVSSSTP